MKNRNLNLISRVAEPTPKWFRIVRNLGLALSAVGGVLVAAPVALPAAVVTVGGYLLLGGSIIGAVSQTAISSEEYGEKSRKSSGNSFENSPGASGNQPQSGAYLQRKTFRPVHKTGFIICFHRFAPFLIKGRNMYALSC